MSETNSQSANSALPTEVEDQAPTLVRYYVIAGLVTFFIIAASVAFIVQQFALNNLVEKAQVESEQLANQFLRESWDQYGEFVASSFEKSADELRDSPQYARLDDLITDLAEDEAVVRIDLYDEHGFVAYSTSPGEVGEQSNGAEEYLDQYSYYWRRNNIASERMRFRTFDAIGGQLTDRQIVITYVWLGESDSNDEEGVIGAFRDVTTAYRRLNRVPLAVTSVAFLITIVPTIRLLLFSGRRRQRA